MISPLLLVLLLGAAQHTGQMSPTSDVSSNRVKATGASTSRALRDRFADTVNVKDYGAKGDGTTNDTVAITAAMTAAGVGGTVFFPPGVYAHTGLTVATSLTLQGSGWSFGTGATTLLNTSLTSDSITIRGPADGMPPGARLFNLYVSGGRNVRPTASGNGIVVDAEGDTLIDQVYVAWAGGHGIKLNGGTFHTTVTTIRHSRVEQAGLDGIYGLGSAAHQINAINIEGNEIVQNLRNGINVWPITLLNIERNTIQGNLGIGIVLDASSDGLGTAVASGDIVNIRGNYLEQNHGGCFYAKSENSGGRIRSMWNLSVRENMFSVYGVGATPYSALARFECDANNGFIGTYWGRNSYYTDTGLAYVDFGNCHEYTSVLDHSFSDAVAAFSSKFINTFGMTIRGLETAVTRYSSSARTGGVTLSSHQMPEVQHWDADLAADYVVTISTANNTTTHGDKFKIIRNGWGPGRLNVGPGLHTFGGYSRGWADFMFNGTAWVKTAEGTVQGVEQTVNWDPGEIPSSGYVTTTTSVPGARAEMGCRAVDLVALPGGMFVDAHPAGNDLVNITIHNRRTTAVAHNVTAFLVKCH